MRKTKPWKLKEQVLAKGDTLEMLALIREAIGDLKVIDFINACWSLWSSCEEKRILLLALHYSERSQTTVFEKAINMRTCILRRPNSGYQNRAAIAEVFIWVLDQLGARETRFPISEKTLTAVRLRARETFVALNLPDEIYKKHSELVNGGAKVLGVPDNSTAFALAFLGRGQGKGGVARQSVRGRMASTPVGKEAEEMKKAQQANENESPESACANKKPGCTIC